MPDVLDFVKCKFCDVLARWRVLIIVYVSMNFVDVGVIFCGCVSRGRLLHKIFGNFHLCFE
jgi:hypothetical protein